MCFHCTLFSALTSVGSTLPRFPELVEVTKTENDYWVSTVLCQNQAYLKAKEKEVVFTEMA